MSHVANELSEAFPDDAETIHALRASNAHFAKLADEHHDINRTIHRAEAGIEPMDDIHLEELKKRRLAILDEIGAMLHNR